VKTDRQHRFQPLTADFWGKLFFTSSEKRSTTGFQYSANASLSEPGSLSNLSAKMIPMTPIAIPAKANMKK